VWYTVPTSNAERDDVTDKTFKIRGRKFVRRILGGYFEAADGSWWLWNSQRGWVEANTAGGAFRECMAFYSRASAILGKHFEGDIFEAERVIARDCATATA
jgi:hypothetical protein